ncbi:MAG: hypothetical protein R3B46_05090 [Phycisphaerales bacterium]
MLVKMIDIKGKEVWLNPVYVKAVSANTRKGYTEVYCSSFGLFGTSTIKVNAPADEVAAALSPRRCRAVPLRGADGRRGRAAEAASRRRAAAAG